MLILINRGSGTAPATRPRRAAGALPNRRHGYRRLDSLPGVGLAVTQSNGALPPDTSGPGPELMCASTLTGNDVYNLKEEVFDDIKDIILDRRTGRVVYAVLSFGGFYGVGDKLFAVPWSTLKLDTVNKRFTLDAEKSRLETAPASTRTSGRTWPTSVGPKPSTRSTAPNAHRQHPPLIPT